ncbi:FAD-dependent oxidoreductase [Mycobacterium sp.]|uniref:NAD(P)/FAD-dependent oxidoreductase n=1 Tax=Mycobacterium sp. TaxID=1785 RepID=UPI0025DCB915|nr:FAD-dependent oxidoreductase [Mycobacterium sp.]
MRKKIVVLGSNFGGLTAAIAVKHDLAGDVDVTVISPSDRFVFNPSLIWLPFGKRSADDITFPVAPTFEEHGVDFVHAPATELELAQNRVLTTQGPYSYDYLVIATGYQNKYDVVPGLGPGGNAYNITSLQDAIEAGEGWRKFLEKPGPVVVGATQGAGCFGAAYEYLFNVSHQLRKNKIKSRVPMTFISPEPMLGHFGIGGLKHGESLLEMFVKKEKIDTRVNVSVDHVDEGRVVLKDGASIDFAYAMLIPPFIGQDVIAKAVEISDEKGYVKVRDTYQTEAYDNVYAVGIAAAVAVPWTTANPVGVPKTGFPTEQQAHIAAKNIGHQVRGEQPTEHKEFGDIKAVCVMDAGNNGVVMLADHMLPAKRKHSVMIPGPQAHLMKLAFEKYFIWKVKNGHVALP